MIGKNIDAKQEKEKLMNKATKTLLLVTCLSALGCTKPGSNDNVTDSPSPKDEVSTKASMCSDFMSRTFGVDEATPESPTHDHIKHLFREDMKFKINSDGRLQVMESDHADELAEAWESMSAFFCLSNSFESEPYSVDIGVGVSFGQPPTHDNNLPDHGHFAFLMDLSLKNEDGTEAYRHYCGGIVEKPPLLNIEKTMRNNRALSPVIGAIVSANGNARDICAALPWPFVALANADLEGGLTHNGKIHGRPD